MTETHEEPQPLQIMVFGAELKRVIAPAKKQSTRNYVLHFEPFDTPKRFADFDGVIVFQGTFEEVEVTRNWMGEEFIKHRFAKDELDKRIKELRLLFAKGGFACFVLCEPFIDDGGSRDLSQTDLVKYFLSVDGLYRYNFPSRVPHVRPMLSEFQPFLDLFGAANSWFAPGCQWNLKSIAISEGKLAGMIFGPQIYCVPSQIPEATRDKIAEPNPRTKEFFELLTDGLVSVVRKQAVTIPEWADAYK